VTITASSLHQNPRPPSTCATSLWYVPGILSKAGINTFHSRKATRLQLKPDHGWMVTVVLLDSVGSANEVAVTVTVVAAATDAGGV